MRRDSLSFAFLGAAVLTAVLVVGSALRWTQAIVAALLAVAVLLQLPSRRRLDAISPITVLLGAAVVLTAIQLIPFPDRILNALNPTGSALREDGAVLAGTHPWHVISLDPSGTMRALAFFAMLSSVALLALRFAASERGRFMLLSGVAITCGIAAVVAGIHTLVRADSLYGLYEPQHTEGVVGPLLNANHMGGLMAMGGVLAVGLAFYHRQSTQLRVLWIVIGLGCVTVTAATLSRGAMIGLVIGLIVLFTLLAAGRPAAEPRRRGGLPQMLPIAVVIGLGLAVALYFSAGNVVDQLDQTSVTEVAQPHSKYAAWKSSLTLVRQSPWVGVGRGAVEPTLTQVHDGSKFTTFSHLENEYLSAIVEWGIPGAVLLAGLFLWCLSNAAKRWRDGPLAAAALGAVAVVVFQSSVDFGVELLGVAVPATIVAATLQLVPLRPTSSLSLIRGLRAALVVALMSATWLLLQPGTRSLQEDHDALRDNADHTMADVREVIERHPLDYFGFGEAAALLSHDNDTTASQFLNHALALHPTHPQLHQLAARMLVGLHGYKQAAYEYSVAMNAELQPHQLLSEIITLLPEPVDIVASLPTDYPYADAMLHSLSDLKREDIAEQWLTAIAKQPQHDLRVLDTAYDMAMDNVHYDAAKELAVLRANVAHTTTSRLMLVRVEFARKEYDAALEQLADVANWTGRKDEKSAAWLIQCDILIERKLWEPALKCVSQLGVSGLGASQFEVEKRRKAIQDATAYESKMAALKAIDDASKDKSNRPTRPLPDLTPSNRAHATP